MASLTDNYGSTFNNINVCTSFKQTIGTTLVALSTNSASTSSYPCSEITIINRTGGNVMIYDNNNFAIGNAFLMIDKDQFTFRGITSTNVISASAASAGDIYYRTAYYSAMPQR